MTIEIAIYGAGGFARETAWLVEEISAVSGEYKVVCFIDDDKQNQGKELNGYPVVSLEEATDRFPDARVVGGVGSPHTRESIMLKAAAAGFGTTTLIHPRVERSKLIEIGEGTVICAGSILAVDIEIHRCVQINPDCTIGHDAKLGEFTSLAPGVHVSGWVFTGKRVYIGTGAVITNGTKDKPRFVGDDAVIGAGAVVIGDVAEGVTVVGVPARPISHRKTSE